ncbi:MAG: hypothetical protein JNJ75_00520 [Cyclobacteriaceae bacterium]|nr:hypothetical protein [Cyclobacteriaceae bacterium]
MENNKIEIFGVENLSHSEMADCYGGDVPWWKPITPIAIAAYIINHWEDVKAGVSDGFNLK